MTMNCNIIPRVPAADARARSKQHRDRRSPPKEDRNGCAPRARPELNVEPARCAARSAFPCARSPAIRVRAFPARLERTFRNLPTRCGLQHLFTYRGPFHTPLVWSEVFAVTSVPYCAAQGEHRLPSYRASVAADPQQKEQSMYKDRKGFTLIELLIVVVIIGILAAIAIPKFSKTREKAYYSAMKSDLKNLMAQQEIYYSDGNYTYASDPNDADLGFKASASVTVEIKDASETGWSATATHAALTGDGQMCAVFYGDAAAVEPATVAGVVTCDTDVTE